MVIMLGVDFQHTVVVAKRQIGVKMLALHIELDKIVGIQRPVPVAYHRLQRHHTERQHRINSRYIESELISGLIFYIGLSDEKRQVLIGKEAIDIHMGKLIKHARTIVHGEFIDQEFSMLQRTDSDRVNLRFTEGYFIHISVKRYQRIVTSHEADGVDRRLGGGKEIGYHTVASGVYGKRELRKRALQRIDINASRPYLTAKQRHRIAKLSGDRVNAVMPHEIHLQRFIDKSGGSHGVGGVKRHIHPRRDNSHIGHIPLYIVHRHIGIIEILSRHEMSPAINDKRSL